MRLCVSCVYWMLLFTSVVSSALLFLIVASETIPNAKFIGPDRNQASIDDENITFIKESQGQLEVEENLKIKTSSILKPKLKEQNFQDFQPPIAASFDVTNKNEESKIPEELEILKESLTQQPNLSQGISEGGQAVVLTLVDTTAASLQSLASGRADFRTPKSNEGNTSNEPNNSLNEDHLQADSLVNISKIRENNETSNETETIYGEADDTNVIVIVRAEQKKPAFGDETRNDESREEKQESEHDDLETEVTLPQPQLPTTAPELNDSAAKTKLSEEISAAVILDSLVTTGPSEPHEEIPSFNEWTQKRLEEAEKKKTHPNASVQTANGSPGRSIGSMRMRSKNYASPDCGAKVVAANPESRGARNILGTTRDEYMLNTCTSRIWFVVELCEAIQAKKIEIANFELFSSSPKEFSVYVSDRFPTRDWSNVGQFTARDERDIQNFLLQPHLFGKFIKVELHSHYGSEHFCPISLFRAYGTSEFEVLETETESDHAERVHEINDGENVLTSTDLENEEDEDEDSLFDDEQGQTNDQPSHLFGSARDAVLCIVRKATEVLVKSEDLKPTNNITKIQENIKGDILEDAVLDECVTPIYSITCRDCNDDRFARVFQLISCKGHYLESLLNQKFVFETLSKSYLCGSSSGFDFVFDSEACSDGSKAMSNDVSNYYLQAQFLSSLFTPDYLIALCNVLAAREQRLFLNASYQSQHQTSDATPNKTRTEHITQVPLATKENRVTPTHASETPTTDILRPKMEVPVIKSKLDPTTESQIIHENLATQIKPTKTTKLHDESKKHPPVTNLESSKSSSLKDSKSHHGEPSTSTSIPVVTKQPSSSQKSTSKTQEQVQAPVSQEKAQREVPVTGVQTKGIQSTDTIHKANEKNVVTEKKEAEVKSEEETEAKTKVEPIEQEPKSVTQDQINFEGFDLKELEESLQQTNGGVRNDFSSTQQIATATTPQQKESVFLRLSNRIKTLERNMSLSSQYLEELSRRYKKQVEEMQRSLERAMTVMNEESRKSEERESKHSEEVIDLRNQIETLNKALDNLVFEYNSWRISFASFLQHSIFVLVDVVVVIFILWFCKRSDEDANYVDTEEERRVRRVIMKPRTGKRTYEIVKQTCSQLSKKTKKRRPSEIAAQVSGTYDQLMIEDSNKLSKKDRRRKRKGILRSTSIIETRSNDKDNELYPKTHSRSASANDALYSFSKDKDNLMVNGSQKRLDSDIDDSLKYFPEREHVLIDRRIQILTTDASNDESTKSDDDQENSPTKVDSSIEDDAFETKSSPNSLYAKAKKLSSSSFMKTALSSRSKRISFSGGNKQQSQSADESTVKSFERKNNSKISSLLELEMNISSVEEQNGLSTNGFAEESDESRASSATPTSSKKEKKTNGLKKMVRRFF